MRERNIWPGIIATLFVIGLLIWLIAMARHGDRAAIAVLAVLASFILILGGGGFLPSPAQSTQDGSNSTS